MKIIPGKLYILFIFQFLLLKSMATDFSDNTFLIAELNERNYNNEQIWNFIENNSWTGIEIEVDTLKNQILLSGSGFSFSEVLEKISSLKANQESKIIPVFVKFDGDVLKLDSIINQSSISSNIFYLPQGETWPSTEYLVQANRKIIFFVEGEFRNESRVLHHLDNYALEISANRIIPNSAILGSESKINRELFKIDNFERLPIGANRNLLIRNMVPDYINYLLENWTKFGKKPNFIFAGSNIYNFDFIVEQLNSFEAIKGRVRTLGKNLEKVYWQNPEILVSGGKFSFPFRGGEEAILTPFAPGFKMKPEQIIVTAEMQIPENYSILASPLNLNEGLVANFSFDEVILDALNPDRSFEGENFSFSQDIDRGTVLKLSENANLNLGNPNFYGLPNSSFTVSCFVKFTEILEFGDNAILGSYEQGYRRGLHLILRSGHPYFGLWANDYMSERLLKNNIWYHLTWRYIIETGEQAIFVDGEFVGGSDGHPPYSGTNDIHLGSALSQGASMRGYVDKLNIWNRPLGIEEIKRLSLDEEIEPLTKQIKTKRLLSLKNLIIAVSGLLFVFLLLIFVLRRKKKIIKNNKNLEVNQFVPQKNYIQVFGEFKAVDNQNNVITTLFTPKIKELFLFVMVTTMQKDIGAAIEDINEQLWSGTDPDKVANNRAVTLNKLRKILVNFDTVEVISNNGFLQLKTGKDFFCDFIEAFSLCQIPEGMNNSQLEVFFNLVKKGRFLKGINWPWLDEIRGFTGNQVIDNLLKLASLYKKQLKIKEVEKVAQRIIDYDDLNEEAVFLQVWSLQKSNNIHLAKFNFESFRARYKQVIGENYPMDYGNFFQHFDKQM